MKKRIFQSMCLLAILAIAMTTLLQGVFFTGELYQAMNAFRRRNFELQSYDDGINRYEEIHKLSLEYEKVLREPLVNDFLIAEQIFSRKLAQVYEMIAEGLELDYDYME